MSSAFSKAPGNTRIKPSKLVSGQYIISQFHFAPTPQAAHNLQNEKVSGHILVTGNPVVDALKEIIAMTEPVQKSSSLRIIATIHRRENHSHLREIFGALAELATDPGVEVFIPIHANPLVRAVADQILVPSRVHLLPPLDYILWIRLVLSANLLISDSGGIQEEAPVLGIPLLVAREVTERPEVISSQYAYLVGHRRERIVSYTRAALSGQLAFAGAGSPFGGRWPCRRTHCNCRCSATA